MFYRIVTVMLFSLLIWSWRGKKKGIDCKPFYIYIFLDVQNCYVQLLLEKKIVKKDSRCFSGNDIIQLHFQEMQFKMTVFMHSMQLVFCFVLCISLASYPRITP